MTALGHLPLMLARRARDVLVHAGIAAEVFRDDAIFEAAQAQYSAQAGLVYLRVLSFDPEAFGLFVDADRAAEAVRRLGAAKIRVSVLEAVDGEGHEATREIPAGEPAGHPYRGTTEERVCLRCGEPEHGARPAGASCVRCGGVLAGHDAWITQRRKVARRWAALFVFALLGVGLTSPRFVACGHAIHRSR